MVIPWHSTFVQDSLATGDGSRVAELVPQSRRWLMRFHLRACGSWQRVDLDVRLKRLLCQMIPYFLGTQLRNALLRNMRPFDFTV